MIKPLSAVLAAAVLTSKILEVRPSELYVPCKHASVLAHSEKWMLSQSIMYHAVRLDSICDHVQAWRCHEANKREKKADLPQSNEEASASGELAVVQVLLSLVWLLA
jgi:hypothetical protein